MSKYKLILMSFDGEYVTERTRFVETFDTVDAAWEHYNDLGSKWFFYPFPFVVTESGLTIAESCDGLKFLNGKRVKTVERLFKEISVLPEMEGVDADDYLSCVRDYYFSKGKSNANSSD